MQVAANTGEARDAKEMELGKVLHMREGSGHTSYAENSLFQRAVTKLAGSIIEERIREVYVTLKPKCLMMAEMGCSSGPNAFLAASRITDIIDDASRKINLECPQFGVFLNDLPDNDFNTLFKLLANFNQGLQEAKGNRFQPCFVSGIPKSYYGRVFPDNFLHFVHSSYSIHFLSQVPRGLVSENGDQALNKGNIYIAETSPKEIHEAYYAQFKKDFTLFLKLRSREIVSQGGMVLVLQGSLSSDSPDSIYSLLGSTLQDMVLQGLIEQEKLDKFNMAFYAPTIEEVREIVEAEGSFAVNKLESFTADWSMDSSQKLEIRAKFVATTIRAVMEPLLETTFTRISMDDLFLLFEIRIKERIALKPGEYYSIVLSVTKKE